MLGQSESRGEQKRPGRKHVGLIIPAGCKLHRMGAVSFAAGTAAAAFVPAAPRLCVLRTPRGHGRENGPCWGGTNSERVYNCQGRHFMIHYIKGGRSTHVHFHLGDRFCRGNRADRRRCLAAARLALGRRQARGAAMSGLRAVVFRPGEILRPLRCPLDVGVSAQDAAD